MGGINCKFWYCELHHFCFFWFSVFVLVFGFRSGFGSVIRCSVRFGLLCDWFDWVFGDSVIW